MGKNRTLASRRRRRKRQKKKKLLQKHQPEKEAPFFSSDTPVDYNDTDDDSFGSPGSPPPTPSDIDILLESPPPCPRDQDTSQQIYRGKAIISQVNHNKNVNRMKFS